MDYLTSNLREEYLLIYFIKFYIIIIIIILLNFIYFILSVHYQWQGKQGGSSGPEATGLWGSAVPVALTGSRRCSLELEVEIIFKDLFLVTCFF